MSSRRITACAGVVGVGMLASLALIVAPSWAAGGIKLCVPKKEGGEGGELVTPIHGKCKKAYKLTTIGGEGPAGAEGRQGAAGKAGAEGKQGPEGAKGLEGKLGLEGKNALSEEELSTLKGFLRCIKSVREGIGGKPTIQFSGCNVQIVNGEAKTQSANGEGNLVIGYDGEPGEQTGSHNLVLGVGQTFTSYGGIVAGRNNTITAPFSSVSGGEDNNASGEFSSVSGGFENKASSKLSSVSGGGANTASGEGSSVGGGSLNTASGLLSSVTGGEENQAKGKFSSIFGGHIQETTAEFEAKP